MSRDDAPLPDRKRLEQILSRPITTNDLAMNEVAELIEAAKWALRAIPPELDFVDLLTVNPINQVYFRAGLLACREYMARFIEQGGDTVTAASVRANWWPELGSDPGPPRLFHFEEVADEQPDGHIAHKPMSPSVEALPRAFQFLARISK